VISPKEIKSLAKAMRSAGIVSLKTSDVEITLSSETTLKPKRSRKLKDFEESSFPKERGFKGYTEEELLTWSSAPVGGEIDAEDHTES
jgi:hypothetical protein